MICKSGREVRSLFACDKKRIYHLLVHIFLSQATIYILFSFLPFPLNCGVAAADTVLTWTSSSVVPIGLLFRLTRLFHHGFSLPLLLPGQVTQSPLFVFRRSVGVVSPHVQTSAVMLSIFSFSLTSSFFTCS